MSKTVQGYVLHDKIGSGQYSNVYRAQHKQKQGLYAVKIMNITKFKETPKLLELVDNQIKILSKLKHPNIIRFYEMFQKPNNYYLVYQFCNGGTLDQLIKSKIKLPQAEAMDIFQQLRAAYSALYEANILHRDLKPTNILFHNGVVKIADFGFCKEMLKEKDMAQTMVGSPIFMAPEVLKGNFYDARADIWSLGIVLFEMLYGFCPYEQQSIPKLISAMNHHLVTFPAQPIVSQQVKGYILLMLTINYKDRLAPSQFVSTNYKNFKPVESHLNYKEVGKYVRSALIYLTETLDTITQFADDLKFLRVAYMIFKIICSILKHTAMNGNYWQNLSIVNTSEQWQFTLKQEEKIIAPYGVIVKEALTKFDASLKTKVELETAIVDLKYFLECINKIGNAPLKQKMINCFLYNKHFVLILQKKSPEWIDPTSKILSMEDKQALCKQYARYF